MDVSDEDTVDEEPPPSMAEGGEDDSGATSRPLAHGDGGLGRESAKEGVATSVKPQQVDGEAGVSDCGGETGKEGGEDQDRCSGTEVGRAAAAPAKAQGKKERAKGRKRKDLKGKKSLEKCFWCGEEFANLSAHVNACLDRNPVSPALAARQSSETVDAAAAASAAASASAETSSAVSEGEVDSETALISMVANGEQGSESEGLSADVDASAAGAPGAGAGPQARAAADRDPAPTLSNSERGDGNEGRTAIAEVDTAGARGAGAGPQARSAAEGNSVPTLTGSERGSGDEGRSTIAEGDTAAACGSAPQAGAAPAWASTGTLASGGCEDQIVGDADSTKESAKGGSASTEVGALGGGKGGNNAGANGSANVSTMAGEGGKDDGAFETCPLCSKSFPRSMIVVHANECADEQTTRSMTEEKKIERAKR